VTVAFADPVGFTELGEAVPPEQLEHIANRLAELARDAVVTPVRFVKTIGDAVMFVASDPEQLLNVALDLVSESVRQELSAAEDLEWSPLWWTNTSGGSASRLVCSPFADRRESTAVSVKDCVNL
jgi:class 3 adenylate cyclase